MLIERISNSWIRFKVSFKSSKKKEKSILARQAFLFVISDHTVRGLLKERMLGEIIKAYPYLFTACLHSAFIYSHEIVGNFRRFCEEIRKRNQVVLPVELNWVKKYVEDERSRKSIEELIYGGLLCASSHWDKARQEFQWTISEEKRLYLVHEALRDKNLGAKRKMEIALEFGIPRTDFAQDYFKKLLRDRHYDQAETLGVINDPRPVIDVIVSNIDNGRFQDALDVAQRFLSGREDIIEEIQKIASALYKK